MSELDPRIDPFYPKELQDIFKEQKQVEREWYSDKRDKRNDRLSIIAILIAFASFIVALIALFR